MWRGRVRFRSGIVTVELSSKRRLCATYKKLRNSTGKIQRVAWSRSIQECNYDRRFCINAKMLLIKSSEIPLECRESGVGSLSCQEMAAHRKFRTWRRILSALARVLSAFPLSYAYAVPNSRTRLSNPPIRIG